MKSARELWRDQDRHEGDRLRLFRAVAGHVDATNVLYPGSFVDVAPSFVFPSVTYVDLDARAEKFFADTEVVAEIIEENGGSGTFGFHRADYREELPLDDGSFDLLVSLYAGPISDSCTRYLKVGGSLLVNPSHGDAALAAIDERYRLTGIVQSGGGDYRIVTHDLDQYLVPASGVTPSRQEILELGKGIKYTKSAFAYCFELIG